MSTTYRVTIIFAPGQDVDSAVFDNVKAPDVRAWADTMAKQMGLKLRDNHDGWSAPILVSRR